MAANRNSSSASSRQRTQTEGSSHNALSFLERSHRSRSSTLPPAVTSPWPVGFVPPSETKVERAFTWTTHVSSTSLPRTSALAFMERPSVGSSNGSSLGAGADAEAGLGWLSGGVVAASYGRGGFLPRSNSSAGGSGSWDSDEEMDSNVCPSMLFTCFPCLSCFRPDKRRLQSGASLLDGSIDNVGSSVKRNPRAQKGLGSPLLTEQPLSAMNFPKDVKLIEVEVESAKNLQLTERVHITDFAGTYAMLRVTPAQEGVGEQAVQTSLATRLVNPNWGGRETFTFFVTDTGSSKAFLGIQLLYRPTRPPLAQSLPPPPTLRREASSASLPAGSRAGDVVIGEGFVDLLGLFPVVHGTYTPGALKGNSRRVAVPLREPEGKRRTKCSVMLGLRYRRVNETIDTHEDRIHEYERWTPLAGWSAAGKRHEGKWSTLDGSVMSDTFTDVAPPARNDAEVVLPWCPFGGWEYSSEEDSFGPATTPSSGSGGGERDEDAPSSGAEGWDNFAVAQKGTVWREGYVQGNHAVRRRLWRRVYFEPGSNSEAVAMPPPA
ncbi:unnamed protein product [Pylaiella littoralis]